MLFLAISNRVSHSSERNAASHSQALETRAGFRSHGPETRRGFRSRKPIVTCLKMKEKMYLNTSVLKNTSKRIVKWVPELWGTESQGTGNRDTSTRLCESGDEVAFITLDLFCST